MMGLDEGRPKVGDRGIDNSTNAFKAKIEKQPLVISCV